ncbi:MAG: (deoxy)nucleoside triphosphate pyrophosphohydrolase [Syntrophotaleaceae bacterium]
MQPLIVTAAILCHNGRILITRRPLEKQQGGLWEFPGGKLHGDESPEEGLKRELLEELGIEIVVGPIFEVAYYRYEWGPVVVLAYPCRQVSGVVRNLEVAEHRWIEPEEFPHFDILPADRPIVHKIMTARDCNQILFFR